jgi:hypothetical protein
MRHAALLPALLIAASASAQTTSALNITLSSSNGGSDTLVSYSFTGDWVTSGGQTLPSDTGAFSGWGGPLYFANTAANLGDPQVSATNTAFSNIYTVDIPSITGTNLNRSITVAFDKFVIDAATFGVGAPRLGFMFTSNNLPLMGGETFRLDGDLSGSFVINQDFSFFNEGSWSSQWFGPAPSTQLFYTGNLTIAGSAVPEPSTYGLILGGLALAGAAIRRRAGKKSK